MQGMHADGSKADGFRSMVVAQFTAVSLQKDDRAFVKYDPSNRRWNGIGYKRKTGELLSQESSSTSDATVFHLDSDAVYRDEWAPLTSRCLTMQSFRLFLSLLLVSISTLNVRVVVMLLLQTPTLTLVNSR